MIGGRYELKGYTEWGTGIDDPCGNKHIVKERALLLILIS